MTEESKLRPVYSKFFNIPYTWEDIENSLPKSTSTTIEYLDGVLSYAVRNADGSLRVGGNTYDSEIKINVADDPKEEKWLKITIE